MRKIISANMDEEKISFIDSYVIRPCSRSDVLNDLIGYVMQTPSIIEHFVSQKNRELENNALLSPMAQTEESVELPQDQRTEATSP